MNPPLRTLGVIPARLASTRLPRKVLREVAGKPLLAWVVEAARACPQLDRVLVATDSEEVAEFCRRIGCAVELTAANLASGTDRVHAVAQLIDADVYVNIQGDEPLVRPEHIIALLRPFARAEVDVSTLKVRCTEENIANPKRGQSGHRRRWSRALLLPRYYPLPPRRRRPGAAVLEAHRALRLSQARAQPLPHAPRRADWNTPSAWSSSAFWRTGSPSTSKPPSTTPSASIRRTICEWSRPDCCRCCSWYPPRCK